jgi:hypothetical protein
MKLVAFCEAGADFQISCALVDRVLSHAGPAWLADVLETEPEAIRSWLVVTQDQRFFVLSRLTSYVDALSIRVPHGHFDGRPGAADAVMGRTAFAVVRALMKRGDVIDAVLVIRDMDDQPERRAGLSQARTEAQSWAPFRIVLGCADPKREAWVLCGFEPENADEQACLQELRQQLGFYPHQHAHQLTATDEQAKRSAKRVLSILLRGDREREERCWKQASLDTLRARGASTGLRDYLDEIEALLVPLVMRNNSLDSKRSP